MEIEEIVKLILSIFIILLFLPLIIVVLLPFLSFIWKYTFTDNLINFIVIFLPVSVISFFAMLFYLKIIKTNFFNFSSRGRKIVLYIIFFILNIVLCLFSIGVLEMYNDILSSIFENKISSFKTLIPIIEKVVTPSYLSFFLINSFLPIPLFIDNIVRDGYPLKWYNWVIVIFSTILLLIIFSIIVF